MMNYDERDPHAKPKAEIQPSHTAITQSVDDWRDELLWDILVGNGTDAIKDSIDGLIAAVRAESDAERERLASENVSLQKRLDYMHEMHSRGADAASAQQAEIQRLTAALAQREQESGDEEMVPHAFAPRTKVADEIWCAFCEYHRDFEIHLASSPTPPEEP